MLFSSFTFLCFFLPIIVGVYYVLPCLLRNTFLLLASLFFYGFANTAHLSVMIMIVSGVYGGTLLMDRFRHNLGRKIILTLTASFVLGVLFFYKYMNFTQENIRYFLKTDPVFSEIILPIGISFYTFQALSYLFDVYSYKTVVQKNYFRLLLYISLFPQLVAGPIVKYTDVALQLVKRHHSLFRVKTGFNRFLIGLGKKVILANILAETADKIFSTEPTALSVSSAWVGMAFYSLQLYFDFSGYSDMAIGLGRMFGFKFLENFNYPYVSKSITQFWRRWHMSLSGWFKEYVYIPLGGNKKGLSRTLINLAFVFLLTGIWHGAAWTFIIWGLWHGFFIICEKIVKKIVGQNDIKMFYVLPHLYTLLIVMIGWVFFRSDTLSYAYSYILLLFGMIETIPNYGMGYYVQNGDWIILGISCFAAVGGFKWLLSKMRFKGADILLGIYAWFVGVLSVCFLTACGYNPFIYFRF